jgi:putative membrane protein
MLTTLLASSQDWHGHGWFWVWPLWLAFWLLLLALAARFFLRRGGRGPDARAIVAERYARGEIDYDEYRERLGRLEER